MRLGKNASSVLMSGPASCVSVSSDVVGVGGMCCLFMVDLDADKRVAETGGQTRARRNVHASHAIAQSAS